jgi:hypothetical protein
MSTRTVGGHPQGDEVEQHLAAAAEYISIAESSDAARAAYEHAAGEIVAAMADDATLTYVSIAQRLKRSRPYVSDLVGWHQTGMKTPTPFSHGGQSEHRRGSDRAATKRIARERPDDFAEAFEQAPPEAKRKIAEQIASDPDVRLAAATYSETQRGRVKPNYVPHTAAHTEMRLQSRLSSAQHSLQDALTLANDLTKPGEDEDTLAKLGGLAKLLEAVRESYVSGASVDTWGSELFEEAS